jgi:hypothetical protein
MFFLWVGFTVLGELLRPKPKFGKPTPSGIGDFQVPTAESGRAIPAIFGTVKMRGPNVVWYGDLLVAAIKKKVKTGLFSSSSVTTGYKYYLGQQMVLCHGPVDQVVEVRYDDRPVPGGKVVINNIKPFQNDEITFGNGPPPWFTAHIAPGQYTNLTTLAQAAQAAMQAAIGTSTWRVAYGYEVQPGVSDEIHYAVRITGGAATDRTAIITPGIYASGGAFAVAIAAAMNAKEALEGGGPRVQFACIYDGGKFTITAYQLLSGFDAWKINGTVITYNTSASVLMGKQMGTDDTMIGFPSSWTSDFPTSAKRFHFGFAGLAGKLGLSENAGPFTSAGVFGLAKGTDITITAKMGDYDKILAGIQTYDSTDKTSFVINAPTMFGGEEREGGITGTLDVYKGTQTQTANDYLQAVLGVSLPAYLGICYAVARKMYVGTSPYLKLISFVLRRCPNQLGVAAGHENIGGDANPACIIYEVLTNVTWGCGVPAALVDAPSFVAAGETLFAEGLGISMIFDSQATAADLISEVLRHVDGVIFADPTSGKLRVKLARPDYNVADLPTLDSSSIDDVKMARPSWDETKNIVKVHYTDRAQNYTDRIAQAQDLANIQARGGEIAEEEFPFRGFSNAAAGQRAAARVLRTVTYPLAVLELSANRTVWRLRPGEVFKLNWGPLGISNMACRVTRIRSGDPRDGKLRIDAVVDIFGIAWTAYSNPGASSWVDPIQPPGLFADSRVIEAPYAMVIGPQRLAISMGANGSPEATGYQVWSDPEGQNYAFTNEVRELTPSALLTNSMDYNTTTIVVLNGPQMGALESPSVAEFTQGGAVLLIDDEMIAFQFVARNSDGTYMISGLVRGVMDTTPVPHAAGARAWFISDGSGLVTEAPYDSDVTVRAKLVPFNSLGVVEIGDVPEVSVVLAARATRPYVVTNFKVNAVLYPTIISGALAMTWNHRNRLGTWSYDDAGLTTALEPGTTYTIRLYDGINVLRRTYSGLTGTSQTWTTEAADSPGGVLNEAVRIEMEAVVGGLVSYQIINFTVFRSMVNLGESLFPTRGIARKKRTRRRHLVASASGD